MRNSLLQLVFGLLLLVLGAGAEDLLPRVFGVGFPVLLVLAQLVARRGAPVAFSVFAMAAGAMADALARSRRRRARASSLRPRGS